MQYPVVGGMNGVAQNLFPDHVSEDLFVSYMARTMFSQWIGGIDQPVHRRQVKSGEGLAFEVPRLYALDWQNPSIDGQRKEGFEQQQRIETMMITLTQYTWSVKNRDLELMRMGTPVQSKMLERAIPQIREASAKHFDHSVLKAATTDVYRPLGSWDNGVMPITARAVAGTLEYEYAGGATLPATVAAAIGAALDETTKASVKFIRHGVDKALASTDEDSIRPYSMTMFHGQISPRYIVLLSTAAVRQLENDPTFIAAFTARGLALQDQPSPVNGAFFVGAIDAALVFRCPELDHAHYKITYAQKTYSWGLLFGVGAWGLGWGLFPRVVTVANEAELKRSVYSHEIRGLQSLRYPSLSRPAAKAEQGIIHLFSRDS
jgi:hypothetical protein